MKGVDEKSTCASKLCTNDGYNDADAALRSQATRIQEKPGKKVAILRALKLRCPNCGKEKLFSSYLKQVEACPNCGEEYAHIHTDDAAPWLTILIVGHIIVPIMVAVEASDVWPTGFSAIFWPAAATLLGGLVLPRAKALILSVIWYDRAPGSEKT